MAVKLPPRPTLAWPTARWDKRCPACQSSVAEPDCRRCGGAWTSGIAGIGHCACPTADAGKPCLDESDCSYRCMIRWDEALRYRDTFCNDRFCIGPEAARGLPWGTCQEHLLTFGCRGWFQRQQTKHGPMRGTRAICVD